MRPALWTFAVSLYGRCGVAEECLALQSRGANVCLLLCGAWLEHASVAYSDERLQALRAVVAQWSPNVVEPLRALRVQWRAQAQGDPALETLREAVKGLELQAEKVLLERLEAAGQGWPLETGATRWLEAMLADVPEGLEGERRGALERLRAAASTA